MRLHITIKGRIDSRELYEKIKKFDANVIDVGEKVFVYVTVDVNSRAMNYIIQACSAYGDIDARGETIV